MTIPSIIFSQIRNQANEATSAFWSDDEIYRLMSEGENLISTELGCSEATTSFSTSDGTREYTVDDNVGRVHRLTWDTLRLRAIDVNQLDSLEGSSYGGSTDTTGQPEYYYRYADVIGFSPVPQETKPCAVYYMKVPTAITNLSTTFSIKGQYAYPIVSYCLWMMFVKDQQLQNEAAFYRQKYYEDLRSCNHDWYKYQYDDRYPQVNVVDENYYTANRNY